MLCRTSLRTVACNRTREDRPKNLRPIFCLHRSPNIPAVQEPACTPRRCSRNRPHTMSTRTDSKRPRQPRPELRCTAVRPVRALRRAPPAALLPQLLHLSQPPPPRIRPPQTRRPNPNWNSCDSRSCSARWKLSKHACSACPLRWLGGYSGFALHRVSKPVERGLDHDTCEGTQDLPEIAGKRFWVVTRSPFIADSMRTALGGCYHHGQPASCERLGIGGQSRFGLRTVQGCAAVSNAGAWPNRRLTSLRRSPI